VPRRSRRKLVGRQPEFDANTRQRELRAWAHELHTLWLAQRTVSNKKHNAT